jgi:hypothetical protein
MHASNPSRRHLPKPPVHHSTMKLVGLHANKMLPPRPQRLPCAGAGAYQCAGAVTTRAMGEWTEQPQAVHHQQRTRPNNPSSMPAAVWRSRPRRPLIISLRTLVNMLLLVDQQWQSTCFLPSKKKVDGQPKQYV